MRYDYSGKTTLLYKRGNLSFPDLKKTRSETATQPIYVSQCDELLFVYGADIKPNFDTTHCRHVSVIISTIGEKISAPDFELLLHTGHHLWSDWVLLNRPYPVWSKSFKSGAEIFYAMVYNVGYICLKHAL